MKKDSKTMTPREYAAERRSLPFGAWSLSTRGRQDWRKIGRGLIAVVDYGDPDKPIVMPGMVYGVEIHGGVIGIAAYRRRADSDRPSSYQYCRVCATHDMYDVRRWPMTYDEMMAEVRAVYPTIWSPGPIDWYHEYGLIYDEATGMISNPNELMEDGDIK